MKKSGGKKKGRKEGKARTTNVETLALTPLRPIPDARRFAVAWSTSNIFTVLFGTLAFFCLSRIIVL